MDNINAVPEMDTPETNAPKPTKFPIERVRKLIDDLNRYRTGKSMTDMRIKNSEDWWRLRNTQQEQQASISMSAFQAKSAWLHNVIANKHADAVEATPEPNILPREPGDRQEATTLTSIIPVIMEQNEFDRVYSDVMWQKMKCGTGCYKVVWDADKLNGLGDIAIEKVNLLNVFWEPGVTDIQKSKQFFHVEPVDKDVLAGMYPDADLTDNTLLTAKYNTDDPIPDDDKVQVVECYYKHHVGPKAVLHYVKLLGEQVLYASEDDPESAERGLYDHGLYPYVFDPLFPVEGSPCGYGFVDLCKNPQTELDLLKTAFVKNAMVGSVPRYFKRNDANINEKDFLDLTKPIVPVGGMMGQDALRIIDYKPLPGNYLNMYDRTINELRETSGNTETATGSTAAGVTAASAIAALQEASGKGSRDSTLGAYRAYRQVINLVIELIRQFYEMPRQFRITGQFGAEDFVSYSNEGLKMQPMGTFMGQDMGMRLPVFDIKVSPQKRNAYSKLSQNELALQFYGLGFFDPQRVDQALATIDLMEFDGKDELMQKLSRNGTMYQKLVQYMQLSLTFAQQQRPDMVQGLANDIQQFLGGAGAVAGAAGADMQTDMLGGNRPEENSRVQNARSQSAQASQPEA